MSLPANKSYLKSLAPCGLNLPPDLWKKNSNKDSDLIRNILAFLLHPTRLRRIVAYIFGFKVLSTPRTKKNSGAGYVMITNPSTGGLSCLLKRAHSCNTTWKSWWRHLINFRRKRPPILFWSKTKCRYAYRTLSSLNSKILRIRKKRKNDLVVHRYEITNSFKFKILKFWKSVKCKK